MSAIEHVTDTAFWVATYRAREGERSDALFHDPLAARLADARGNAMAAEMPQGALVGWSVVLRTRMIDDFITSAIADGVDCVLNLGAGLDTRPYRMQLPPTLLWVEADFPSTIDFKEKTLAGETPRCRLERKSVDLSNDTARRALLSEVASRAEKILVITEGVVPYLTNDQVAALADDLRAQPHVAAWIADYAHGGASPLRRLLLRGRNRSLKNAPMQFQPPDWSDFFLAHGWQAKDVRYFGVEGERVRRPPPIPRWLRLLLLISPPGLQKKLRSSMGYALFTRR